MVRLAVGVGVGKVADWACVWARISGSWARAVVTRLRGQREEGGETAHGAEVETLNV
jgi:hypothetical protein